MLVCECAGVAGRALVGVAERERAWIAALLPRAVCHSEMARTRRLAVAVVGPVGESVLLARSAQIGVAGAEGAGRTWQLCGAIASRVDKIAWLGGQALVLARQGLVGGSDLRGKSCFTVFPGA